MDLLEAAIYIPIIGIPLKLMQYIAIPLLVVSVIMFFTENIKVISLTIIKVGLIALFVVLTTKLIKNNKR